MRALIRTNQRNRHYMDSLLPRHQNGNSAASLPTAVDWYGHVTRYVCWLWRMRRMNSCHTHLLLFLSRSFLRLWFWSQSLFLHFLPVNERQKIIHWAVINHSCICRRLFLLLYRLMRLRKKPLKFHHACTKLSLNNLKNYHRKQQEHFTGELEFGWTKWSQNTSPKLGFVLRCLVPLVSNINDLLREMLCRTSINVASTTLLCIWRPILWSWE